MSQRPSLNKIPSLTSLTQRVSGRLSGRPSLYSRHRPSLNFQPRKSYSDSPFSVAYHLKRRTAAHRFHSAERYTQVLKCIVPAPLSWPPPLPPGPPPPPGRAIALSYGSPPSPPPTMRSNSVPIRGRPHFAVSSPQPKTHKLKLLLNKAAAALKHGLLKQYRSQSSLNSSLNTLTGSVNSLCYCSEGTPNLDSERSSYRMRYLSGIGEVDSGELNDGPDLNAPHNQNSDEVNTGNSLGKSTLKPGAAIRAAVLKSHSRNSLQKTQTSRCILPEDKVVETTVKLELDSERGSRESVNSGVANMGNDRETQSGPSKKEATSATKIQKEAPTIMKDPVAELVKREIRRELKERRASQDSSEQRASDNFGERRARVDFDQTGNTIGPNGGLKPEATGMDKVYGHGADTIMYEAEKDAIGETDITKRRLSTEDEAQLRRLTQAFLRDVSALMQKERITVYDVSY